MHLDHQDIDWLGGLLTVKGGTFELEQEFAHPEKECMVRASRAWSYERSTQTASVVTLWEEIGADREISDSWEGAG